MSKKQAASRRPSPVARLRKAKLLLHVEVLQNGASLASAYLPLRRRGRLGLTSSGSGPFVLPHYPLTDGRLDFLRFTATGVELDVDHLWEGFCTSHGELISLSRQARGRHQVVMERGDYASISEGDLRLMIKLAPRPDVGAVHLRGTDPAYRRPLFAHFFPSLLDVQMTAVGFVVTTVVLGGAIFGLLNRPYSRPTRLADLSESYALPFIAPAHLTLAPEAVQDQFDRRRPLLSVMSFYQAFTATLMGWQVVDKALLYPSTTGLYAKLHAQAQQMAQDKWERQQEVDRLQEMKSAASLLTIPSVIGESVAGSMLRVIDKIGIMQDGLAHNLKAKRDILETFPRDPDYAWDEYKNIKPGEVRGKTALEQVRAFSSMTDEEMMYAEAAALASKAATMQSKIFNQIRAQSELQAVQGPIGMPDGVKFVTFAADRDLQSADEKLYQLQGSEYGVRVDGTPRIKEPLIGVLEPGLIERYIKENRFQLQLCYELALRRNEQVAGVMEWTWRIDSRGVISEVALNTSSIRDPRMTECIRQKIMTWRFPRPRQGSVEVSFPFEFAPTKG